MKLTIDGTPEEIKNALKAICGSEEREALEMVISEVNYLESSVATLIQNVTKKRTK